MEKKNHLKNFIRPSRIKMGSSAIAKDASISTQKNITQHVKRNSKGMVKNITQYIQKSVESTKENITQHIQKNAENIGSTITRSIGMKKGHTIEHTGRLDKVNGLARSLMLKGGQGNVEVVRLKALTLRKF